MNDRRLLVAAGLAAVACPAFAFPFAREARGSGNVAVLARPASGFDRVAIGGPFEVELRQGGAEGVELSGDDNLLGLVETRVVGDAGARTLKIDSARGVDLQPTRPIRIRVDLMRLSGVDVAGSGQVSGKSLRAVDLSLAVGGSGAMTLSGLEATHVGVRIGGSGRVVAEGRATSAQVSIGGSGRGSLGKLAADDVSVSIAGSGVAEVQASQRLRISIAGSGRVLHSGAAVPTVSIAGSGRVGRA